MRTRLAAAMILSYEEKEAQAQEEEEVEEAAKEVTEAAEASYADAMPN